MSNLYFRVSFAYDFFQRSYFWVQLLKARTRLLLKLVSTDSPGKQIKQRTKLKSFGNDGSLISQPALKVDWSGHVLIAAP